MIQHNGCAAHIVLGSVLDNLRTMPDGLARMCVTSPPYFGLRDYGVDGQIGLEETPEQFIAALVEVFREVRRVLKDDGTLWVNIGDTYAAARGGTDMPAQTAAGGVGGKGDQSARRGMPNADTNRPKKGNAHRNAGAIGLKHKDMIGIPWMLAFALRADGWYLRQEIIWHKPNPMPESVTDRCTKAHEQIFLLSKSPKYFCDMEAIREPVSEATVKRMASGAPPKMGGDKYGDSELEQDRTKSGQVYKAAETRNKRSVWTVAPRAFSGAHFAVYPPELIEPCILAGSAPGDIVLEPFSGSGTTAGVSLKHGRNCLAFELNPEYAALTPDRVASIVGTS